MEVTREQDLLAHLPSLPHLPHRMDRPSACSVLGCSALTLLGVWLNFSGRGGVLSVTEAPTVQTVYYACRLIAVVLVIVCYRSVFQHIRNVSVLCGVVIVVGTTIRLLSLQPNGIVGYSNEMALVGGALCGLGYLPCIALIYYGLAQSLPLSKAVGITLVALVFKQQLPSLLLLLPAESHAWMLLLITSLFLLSLVKFWDAVDDVASPPKRMPEPLAKDAQRYTVALGFIAEFAQFVFGTVSGVGLVGSTDSSATHGAMLVPVGKTASLLVLASLGYLLVVRRINRPVIERFVPAFVALSLFTALFTAIMAIDSPALLTIASSALTGVYDFNQLLVWALVICLCRRRSASAIRGTFCILCVYNVLASVIGPFLDTLTSSALPGYSPNLVSIFCLVIAIIATVALPFAMAKASSKNRASTQTVDPYEFQLTAEIEEQDGLSLLELKQAMTNRCHRIAKRYGLTQRESEVFELLCQGFSRSTVCSELNMAEGTAKTHIAHIYEKTGVNTREALTALVFADPSSYVTKEQL